MVLVQERGVMKTQQLYLGDSYKKEMDATILDVIPENGDRYRVLLDQTVFYPMGGGQPTDQGTLTGDGFQATVYQILMKDGEIWHFVEAVTPPTMGLQVHGTINWDRRFLNMRLHSGGHVVDFAMFQLGYSPKLLMPQKGDHGKKPYIVYAGVVDKDIVKELEEKANKIIAKDLQFTTAIVPLAELTKDAIYLQPGLPTDKPLRKLTLESVGSVADGGTQVSRTSEVGHITISSVVQKDGSTIISYVVS